MVTQPHEPTEVLVFGDPAGDYYAVPRAVFEQYRVSDAQRGEIERLLADRGDTEGFVLPLVLLAVGTTMFATAWAVALSDY